MIFLFPLIVFMAADVQAKPPEQIYKDALPSVLTFIAENKDGTHSQGLAFLAIDHGLAVMAWHVVEGAKRRKPSPERISYFSSISFFTALNPSVCRR